MDAATLTVAPVISIQDEAIDKLRAEYMPLAITDLADKKQLAVVKKARLHVRDIRIAAEKKHKELKADALAYGRACDAELNRIKGRLEPIESHLKAEEDKPKREAERIAFEKEQERKAMIRTRLKALAECDCIVLADDVADLSEEQFQSKLVAASMAKQARDEQLAAEAEARRIEQEKLAAERAELERQKAEHAAEVARLEAAKAEQERPAAPAPVESPAAPSPATEPQTDKPHIDSDFDKLAELAQALEAINLPKLSAANQKLEEELFIAWHYLYRKVATALTNEI
jgi:hypothetical protein